MPSFDPRRHEIRYCNETIVSFAQNSEDALIFRAFGGKRNGRFIDVGAGHPIADNVTMWLSMMGWTGINVEPNPIMFQELVKYRPKDINLNLGVAAEVGRLPFHHVHQNDLGHGWGLSSFDPPAKDAALNIGFLVETKPVEVDTINNIVERFHISQIDLLKIDVEGMEKSIIESIHWQNLHIRLLCIESVMPNSALPTWPQWEDCLLNAGYRFAHFDGCNAYYARSDERDILGQLSAGINSNDRVRRANEQDYPSL